MKVLVRNNMKAGFASMFLLVLSLCPLLSALALPASTDPSAVASAPCVTVKNAHYGEYLHTAPLDVPADPFGSRVFTWMVKNDGPARSWGSSLGEEFKYQGVWKLTKTNTCEGCYTIKSAFFKDNSLAKSYNSQVEIVPGFTDRKRIKINFADQYLYIYATPEFNQNRRYVFPLGSTEGVNLDNLEASREWVIEHVECPSYAI